MRWKSRLHSLGVCQPVQKKLRRACSLRFPVSCQSRLQDWVEWAMPLLQGGVGDVPGTLKPIYQRSHDVAFIRCEQRRFEPHVMLFC